MYCGPYSAGVLHSVSDQIQNLQNCFTTPNENDQKRRHYGIGVFKVPSSMHTTQNRWLDSQGCVQEKKA
jgi:hypothetical protein